MMNEPNCTYPGKRDEALVSYLYEDLGADDRAAFDRHLTACAICRAELEALGAVRSRLLTWTPPAVHGGVAVDVARPVASRSPGAVFRELPGWARAAAALLVCGVSAGVANLEVSSTPDGVSIRTGWRRPSPVDRTNQASASAPGTADAAAPWHDDLSALDRQWRTALDAQRATAGSAAASASPADDEALVGRVRALIQESERRQQRELALRVAEVAREMQAQRQVDLVKIDRSLGLIQSRTGMEVMRTQRQMNSLAQQVSQRP